MKCPGCGADIPNPGRFCGACGKPLEQKLCPNGHVMAAGVEICPICATTKHPTFPAEGVPPSPAGKVELRWDGVTSPPAAPGKVSGVATPDKGKTLFEIGAWQETPLPQSAPDSGSSGAEILFETPASPARVGGGQAAAHAGDGVRKTRMLGSDPDAAPAAVLAGWLVTEPGRRDGRDYRLMGGRNTIGAGPRNDIVLDDDSVSSNHAVVVCEGGGYYLEDNKSTNGTSVNGSRVTRQDLKDGDAVSFGTFPATFYSLKKGN